MTVGHPQAAHTMTDYDDMKRAAVLSDGILHLMSAYNGCRWAAFGTGLAALLVFPVVMIASAFASRIFIAARGKDSHCQLDRHVLGVRTQPAAPLIARLSIISSAGLTGTEPQSSC